MRDGLLQTAGAIAIVVALVHGLIGETKIFAHGTVEPARLRLLLRMVWQAGTVAWVGGGVLLAAVPSMASDSARHWIVAISVVVFGFAAAGNAWVTRFRHVGWVGMTAVVMLAVAGY